MIELRDYQEDIVNKFHAKYQDDDRDKARIATAMVVPTGGGKTVIFAAIANDVVFNGGSVLVLVHTEELAQQTVKTLRMVAPELSVGVCIAGQNEIYDQDVIVASVQTLARPARLNQFPRHGFALIVVDEGHHAAAPSYRKILRYFEDSDVLGVTATLSHKSKTLGDVYPDGLLARIDILDLINKGHLVDVKGKSVYVESLDLDQVTVSAGDYSRKSLTEHLLSSDAQRVTAEAYRQHASDRQGIVFVPTVEAIHAYAQAFQTEGFTTGSVWGEMEKEVRQTRLDQARRGDTQVLINCGVLTEGFDLPELSCCVIARPTRSANLFIQMVGRVLRPAANKQDALVLDVSGAGANNRLASLVDLSSRRVCEVKQGEGLAQAARREKKGRNPYLSEYVVQYGDLDLFADSRITWLQTRAGVYFVECEREWVFIWPGDEPGTYHVGSRPTKGKGGGYEHTNVTLDIAFAWGETMVHERQGYTSRDSSWRRRPASPASLNYAKRLGLQFSPGGFPTGGQVSDAIAIEKASKVFDKALTR